MTHRILVPFELPDAAPLSPVLVEDLAPMEVVLLGHWGLPEQTSPEAARNQFGDEARAELEELARPFEEAGTPVTTRLVFGKDRAKTIDRVAREEDCDAELDPAPTEGIERILVPLRDTENLDRIADFVAALCDDQTTEVTLFHVAEQDAAEPEDPETVESMLDEARTRLIEGGFEPWLVDVTVVTAAGHDEAILEKANVYDAVVMGEAHPSVHGMIFGTLPDRIAERTGDPVIVVRRHF